jgi:O-antigen ligase
MESMTSMTAPPDQDARSDKRQHIADVLALAVVVLLPWSISATLFLTVLWLIAVVVALKPSDICREFFTIVGGMPILLFFLAIIGTLWANVSWAERLGGVDSFLKLLAIPLLFAQFRRSNRAPWLLIGYLSSCAVLLVFFDVTAIRSGIGFSGAGQLGPAVKNATTETSEFIICSFVLLFMATDALRGKRWSFAFGAFALAAVLLASIFYVFLFPGYWFIFQLETLLTIVALLLLLAHRQFGTKVMLGLLAVGIIACSLVYVASPNIRNSLSATELLGISRPVFWSKSLQFIEQAPIIGHGTGSIGSLFAQSAKGQIGTMAQVTTNPYQETLAVGIQLGIVGITVLWAMWISHIYLFRGRTLADWIGSVIVVYTVIGSMLDSELFDSHRGWTYVFGVGIAGGVVLRTRINDRIGQRADS